MKVFISHAFGGTDEPLASTLKEDLGAAGINGYLAEKAPQYGLPISDKIRREIEESGWLVAIITERSHASASVHEEIGYAFGKGVMVALMVEEGAEAAGVFTYGREHMRFTVPGFSGRSKKMVEHIANSPRSPPLRHSIRDATKRFLEGRNILSASTDNFAVNKHFRQLFSPVPDDRKKPAVLFTACPHDMRNSADVTSPEFVEWAEATAGVEVDGQRVRVLLLDPQVDIETLLATIRHPHAPLQRNILAYREFQSSGFFEFGSSHIFFGRRNGRLEMHLCYLVGEFWSFLAQARLFYRKIGIDAPFTAFVSVRNNDLLHLANYGDEESHYSPYGNLSFGRHNSSVRRRYILLHHSFESVRGATDEEIARAAKETAKKVCNAYGETTPRCYNKDGSFSWGMWHAVARGAARGDRL